MPSNDEHSLSRDAREIVKAGEELFASSAETAKELIHPSDERELRNEDVRFEPKDVSHGNVILIGAALLIVMWAVVGLLSLYFSFLSHYRAEVSPPALPYEEGAQKLPPEPRLQPSPTADLQTLRAREDDVLSHYRWIDRSKGIVGIPIDRAIQLTAQRGIPPQKAPAGLVLSKPEEGTPLTGFEGKVGPEPR
jgi:hypothetical protein